MLTSIVFLSLFPLTNSLQMVVVYGEPSDMSESQEYQGLSLDDCIATCYWDNNCFLAYYSSVCHLFEYGNMSVKSSKSVVAFKTRNYECPSANSSFPEFSTTDRWIENDVGYENEISPVGEISWKISFSIFQCSNNSKIFLRDTIFVCIGVRFFPNITCGNHNSAIEFCKTDGWSSITGPNNLEELAFLNGDIERENLVSKKYGNYLSLVWIDGNLGGFLDETHGDYTSTKCYDLPSNACLYIGHNQCTKVAYFSDCNTDKMSPYYCWRGVACRKEADRIN